MDQFVFQYKKPKAKVQNEVPAPEPVAIIPNSQDKWKEHNEEYKKLVQTFKLYVVDSNK